MSLCLSALFHKYCHGSGGQEREACSLGCDPKTMTSILKWST
jgi:hypothetical protein